MATIADFGRTTLDPDQETAFLKWLAQSDWFKKIAEAMGASTADARAALARQMIEDPDVDLRGAFAAGVTPTADDYGHLTIPDTVVLKGVDTYIKSPAARFQDAFTREFGISSDFFDPFPQRAIEAAASMNLVSSPKVAELKSILAGGSGGDRLDDTAPPTLDVPTTPTGIARTGLAAVDIANLFNNPLGFGLQAGVPGGLLAGALSRIAGEMKAQEVTEKLMGRKPEDFFSTLRDALFGTTPAMDVLNTVNRFGGWDAATGTMKGPGMFGGEFVGDPGDVATSFGGGLPSSDAFADQVAAASTFGGGDAGSSGDGGGAQGPAGDPGGGGFADM